MRFLFRSIEHAVSIFSGVSSSLFLSGILNRWARITQMMINLKSIYMDMRTFSSTGAPSVCFN